MKRLCLLLLLLAGAAGFGLWRLRTSIHASRAWAVVESFAGGHVGRLDTSTEARLEKALALVIPGRPAQRVYFGYQRVALWAFDDPRRGRRLVLLERATEAPGTVRVRVHTMDVDDRRVSTRTFTAGPGLYVQGLVRRRTSISPLPLLQLIPDPNVFLPGRRRDGSPSGSQVYALIGDDWRLVRIEDEGRLIPVEEGGRHFRCGPLHRPVDDWHVDENLRSTDPARVLSALAWLARLNLGRGYLSAEHAGESALIDAQLARPEVKERLRDLATSFEPWIAETAAFALSIR